MLVTKARYSNKPVTVGGESIVEIYINTAFDDKVLKLLMPSYLSFLERGGGTAYISLKYILCHELPNIHHL
jgi:hypothetical protein